MLEPRRKTSCSKSFSSGAALGIDEKKPRRRALRTRWRKAHSRCAARFGGTDNGTRRWRQARWLWSPVLGGLLAVMPAPTHPLAQQRPVITTAARIVAPPTARTPLAIAVGPQEGLPRNTYLRIRGLPQTVALSEGHAIAPGVWAIPLSALPLLAAIVPTGAQGSSEINLDLLSLEGKVLAEAKTLLIIPAADLTSPSPLPPPASPQVGSAALAGPAQVAAANHADRERALGFYGRGLELLQRGDVDAARKFFERAADLGLSQAALALATSYDPNELGKLKVIGLQANVATARKWYNRAAELGAAEAGERLRRLGTP